MSSSISIFDVNFPNNTKCDDIIFSVDEVSEKMKERGQKQKKEYILIGHNGDLNNGGHYFFVREEEQYGNNPEFNKFYSAFIDKNGVLNTQEIEMGMAHESTTDDIYELYIDVKSKTELSPVNLNTILDNNFPQKMLINEKDILLTNAEFLLEQHNKVNNTNYKIVAASLKDEQMQEDSKLGFNTYVAVDNKKDASPNKILYLNSKGIELNWENINNNKSLSLLKNEIIKSIFPAVESSIKVRQDIDDNGYLIFDYLQNKFWKKDGIGHTKDESEAGRFEYYAALNNIKEGNSVSSNLIYMEMIHIFDDNRLKEIKELTNKPEGQDSIRNKKSISDILATFNSTYHKTNPLGAIEDAFFKEGYYFKQQHFPHVDYEKTVRLVMELEDNSSKLNINLYRMPSGNYEVNAYENPEQKVKVKNKKRP